MALRMLASLFAYKFQSIHVCDSPFWMIQIPHMSVLCCVVLAPKAVGFKVIFGRLHSPAQRVCIRFSV